jgi:hypothetical protein
MRVSLVLPFVLLFSVPLSFSCGGADASAGEEDFTVAEGAVATSGRTETKRYVGTFTDSGETFTVELEVALPVSATGFQRAESNRFLPQNGSVGPGSCRVFNDWTKGTIKLRVLGKGGRVVAEKSATTAATGTSGKAQLDGNRDCPNGVLTNPRVYSVLSSDIQQEGAGFTANGQTLHVPRGYFSPGVVAVPTSSSFRQLAAGTFKKGADTANVFSSFVTRGVITVGLPAQTSISVGINPSSKGALGYERTIEVILRAR